MTSMTSRSKFQDKWLQWKDCNGTLVSEWARKDPQDQYRFICTLCNPAKSSSCDKGFERLLQHAKTVKHLGKFTTVEPGQVLFEARPEITDNLSGQSANILNKVTMFNPREAATRAELLWCMEVVQSNSSAKSCDNKKDLFQVMFPGGCPEGFSLSRTKVQYLISEALGPYFKDTMLLDIKKPDILFTYQFDETSNAKSMKELQIRVRFWSSNEKCIVTRHLETYFIEKGDGDTLFRYLKKAIESNGLSYDQILTLGCDGPNVNKKVWQLFEEHLHKLNLKRLLDIGTCNLHIAHNAFLKGTDCFSLDASDFIVKIYYYFHKRDLRCEEYSKIQEGLELPPHVFIMHCTTRWLTLGPAAERVVEQLPGLEEYFLRHVPKKYPKTLDKKNYLDIKDYLTNPALKSNLQFIAYSAKIFTKEFTLLFQKEEPLIHILYSQLKKLILLLLSSVVKPEVLQDMRFDQTDFKSFLSKFDNFVDLKDVHCGEKARESMKKLTQKDKSGLQLEIKNFFIESVKHLTFKIKDFTKMKYFKCISPDNIKDTVSVIYITKIAALLPLKDVDTDEVITEWKLLQQDEDVRFSLNKNERIDDYWNHIFSLKTTSNCRYPILKYVIQNALAITHGSADVERGFSKSGQILTDKNSNLIERTLNAKLAIVDGLKQYSFQIHKVPLTEDLLKRARHAHLSYLAYLEEEKRIVSENLAKQAAEAERSTLEKALLANIIKEKKRNCNFRG